MIKNILILISIVTIAYGSDKENVQNFNISSKTEDDSSPVQQPPMDEMANDDPENKSVQDQIDDLKRELIPTDLLGWTVFQRRMDGSVNFYRNWYDYVNGFGDPEGEFWLGLKKIENLMSLGKYELRIDMQDFDGQWRYAYYKNFKIGTASADYPITTSGYKGNAGDCITMNNVRFSTKDRDHDGSSINCASVYKGAWWYRNCHCANLNGKYLAGSHSSYADGVEWKGFRGHHYSLKFTEMKMRRRPH